MSAHNSKHHDFLRPQCLATTLDIYLVRRAILQALYSQAVHFKGTLLDVGCGQMPYKELLLSPPSHAESYIGLDLKDGSYGKPDLEWDGRTIPLDDDVINCAVVTEVLEHCPDPESLLRETKRVLKPGGLIFFTVPFLWPLHDVPHDEYRYTPFALERHLQNAGFREIVVKALGGWDASLAQMIGLWVRRRPMTSARRAILSTLAVPLIRYLVARDQSVDRFCESQMITGLFGTATKPVG